jgi:predicted DNA-binding transcriptional regulator AlpA
MTLQNETSEEVRYLFIEDICKRLRITRQTWHRWIRNKLAPPPAPLPGHPRWRVSDIERFERGRT